MANKERVAQLVAALRSGKYTQYASALRGEKNGTVVGHCCLGVACDIYRKATRQGVDWDAGRLPTKVMNWFGFEDGNPVIGEIPAVPDPDCSCDICTPWAPGEMKGLTAAAANDDEKWSFGQIADAFEDRYVKAATV